MKRIFSNKMTHAALLAGSMLAISGQAQAFLIDGTTAIGDEFILDFLLQPGETDNGGNTLGGTVDLSAQVTYTITGISYDSSVDLSISIANTTSTTVNDSILAFGFDTSPESSVLSFTGGSVFDGYAEDTNFPSFNNVEFCTYPDSPCSGGPLPNGLAPGTSDTIMLSLSWGGGPLTIDPSMIKFQGDLGSYQLEGGDCCTTTVPEPGTLSLLGVASIGLGLIARRRRLTVKNEQA